MKLAKHLPLLVLLSLEVGLHGLQLFHSSCDVLLLLKELSRSWPCRLRIKQIAVCRDCCFNGTRDAGNSTVRWLLQGLTHVFAQPFAATRVSYRPPGNVLGLDLLGEVPPVHFDETLPQPDRAGLFTDDLTSL